jgi:hypothetical protein
VRSVPSRGPSSPAKWSCRCNQRAAGPREGPRFIEEGLPSDQHSSPRATAHLGSSYSIILNLPVGQGVARGEFMVSTYNTTMARRGPLRSLPVAPAIRWYNAASCVGRVVGPPLSEPPPGLHLLSPLLPGSKGLGGLLGRPAKRLGGWRRRRAAAAHTRGRSPEHPARRPSRQAPGVRAAAFEGAHLVSPTRLAWLRARHAAVLPRTPRGTCHLETSRRTALGVPLLQCTQVGGRAHACRSCNWPRSTHRSNKPPTPHQGAGPNSSVPARLDAGAAGAAARPPSAERQPP